MDKKEKAFKKEMEEKESSIHLMKMSVEKSNEELLDLRRAFEVEKKEFSESIERRLAAVKAKEDQSLDFLGFLILFGLRNS